MNDSQDKKRMDHKKFVMLLDLSMKMVDSLKESSTNVNELSSWFYEVEPLKFDKLRRNTTVDVAIIGGGIAGLPAAYNLSKAGKSVVVLEDGYIGSGETGHTTAHLTHALDDRYFNLEKLFGKDGAVLAAESHTTAIDFIESVVEEEKIKCDFERLNGYLFLSSEDDGETLDKEYEATRRSGILTELIPRSPLTSFDTGLCIKFPHQAQFHPLKYLSGLSKSILTNNGEIFTETHVHEVSENCIKTLDDYQINTKNIIIATNAPIVDKVSKIYDKQIPYRTYVIGAMIKKGSVPKGLYWDTGNMNSTNTIKPNHYVRIQKLEKDRNSYSSNNPSNNELESNNEKKKNNTDEYELLIIGGEDHKTGNENDIEDRHTFLEAWTKERFPIEKILFKWSGQVMEPVDSLAFIGENPNGENEVKNKKIYIATGDSGNGMTHGTIAGILLSDLIPEKQNKWTWLYNPSRTIRNIDNKEDNKSTKKDTNNNNSKSDQKSEDNPTSINNFQNKSKIESLLLNEGAIIDDDPKNPIAIFKDKQGQIHAYSAKCTHLGCTLTWNPLETSFDCPCHGSRFYNNSEVINGPDNTKLPVSDL